MILVLYEYTTHNGHWLCVQLQNVLIDSVFPSEYFEVLFSTKNGTYHIVRTLQKGSTDIDGELNTVIKGVCTDILT